VVRHWPRRQQEADRLAHLQYGPLPVDRHRRRGQSSGRGPSSVEPGDAHRVGHPDRSPPPWAATTRSAITAALSGPTTLPSRRPALARYGFEQGAQQLVTSLLAAGMAQGGRLPELFAGLDRSELAVPVGYPRPAHRRHGRPRRPCCACGPCSDSIPGSLRQTLAGSDGPQGVRAVAGGGNPACRLEGRCGGL